MMTMDSIVLLTILVILLVTLPVVIIRLSAQAKEKNNSDDDNFFPKTVGSGGYIVLDLPEEQKSIFHDLLKGFEDYSLSRGYKVEFSVDNSIADKIAFKFTIMEAKSS